MFRNLGKATQANPAMRAALEAKAQSSRAGVDKTLALADQALISATEITHPAGAYFDEFTRTIDGLFEFNALAMSSLVHAMEQRERALRRTQLLVLVSVLLGLAASTALAVVFVRSITGPVAEAVAVARAVADGDLRVAVPVRGSNELGQLMLALSAMRDELAQMVSQVMRGSENVAIASAQIAQGNLDLSGRTEKEASALQQTSASMEQLGATVQSNADNAREANQLAKTASAVALRGGEVVALVEESAAAAGSLRSQAEQLQQMVAVFRV